jgi:hypothetical protein
MNARCRTPRWTVAWVLLALAAGSPAAAQTLLTESTWGGPDSDVARGGVVAADGSSFVVGMTRSFGANPPNVFILRYAPDGTLVWQRTWEGPLVFFGNDEALDVALGPDGSVHVSGDSEADAFLLKLDAAGNLVWQRKWGAPAGVESGEGVAVAQDGSVYLSGGTSSLADGAFVVKFDAAGNLVWQKTWGIAETESGGDVAVGPDGSVYTTSVVPRPGVDFEFDVVVVKLDPAGNLVWQRAYAAGEIVDGRGGITVASDGSVYVAGALQTSKSNAVDMDVLLLKLAADGTLVWDRTWGGKDGEEPLAVAVGADGNVLFAGGTSSFGADDAYYVQVSPDGKGLSAATWGGAGLESGAGVGAGADGVVSLAASAEAPPYVLAGAPSKTSRARGTLRTPDGAVNDAGGTAVDAGGTLGTPAGSTTYAGSFDAALVRIAP